MTTSLRWIAVGHAFVVAAVMSAYPAAAIENDCPVQSFIHVCLGEGLNATGVDREPTLPSGWWREGNRALSDVSATTLRFGAVDGDSKVYYCSFASAWHAMASRASYCTRQEVGILTKWLAENGAKRTGTFDDGLPPSPVESGPLGWLLQQKYEAEGLGSAGPFPADWLRERRSGVWKLARGRAAWTVTFVFHPPGETLIVSAATYLSVEKRALDLADDRERR